MTSETAITILFGWLLGLLSPVIVDYNRQLREGRDLKSAIQVELNELRYRLMLSAYMLKQQFDTLDRVFLEKMKSILADYNGINKKENIQNSIDVLLKLTDEQLVSHFSACKAEDGSGVSLKKHSIPFLDSKLNALGWVSDNMRSRLLELKTQLSILNEIVDDTRYYHNLTFQQISDGNHQKAVASVQDCYRHYASRAEIIVNSISTLMSGLNKGLKNA